MSKRKVSEPPDIMTARIQQKEDEYNEGGSLRLYRSHAHKICAVGEYSNVLRMAEWVARHAQASFWQPLETVELAFCFARLSEFLAANGQTMLKYHENEAYAAVTLLCEALFSELQTRSEWIENMEEGGACTSKQSV